MKITKVPTCLGNISVLLEEHGRDSPVVFLHGVFLDRSLWEGLRSAQTGRTHVLIDMPSHGDSANVGRAWKLEECATMLLQILDHLEIPRCIAVGHSWGGMTTLRAARAFPERFEALGFFNTPFRRASGFSRIGFHLQKRLTVFPRFYAAQAARALYTKTMLQERSELLRQMQDRLAARPPLEITRVIQAVLLDADDALHLIETLTVPALFVAGEKDYVGVPPTASLIVPGGHITPHEAPRETQAAVARVVSMADRGSRP